ncbi:Vms1/Ankzf1 family peptidyl-tRNA hydrolase [Ornithinimicrobium sp. INDO-MA30-4]|uniref:Vms1/Ankzf1 family peptidyl-tRNA hydrolase n=1 Tax=Ornithinimicrobium sp. INDO-MA30-4 TaxID=2908651 RepID=UPI0037C9B7AE
MPPPDLTGWAAAPSVFGLVLVRRGGYTVGVVENAALVRHYAGTRYVQSRTAAGGWSQQRYARRRGNQADALVNAVADRAAAMWSEHNLGE